MLLRGLWCSPHLRIFCVSENVDLRLQRIHRVHSLHFQHLRQRPRWGLYFHKLRDVFINLLRNKLGKIWLKNLLLQSETLQFPTSLAFLVSVSIGHWYIFNVPGLPQLHDNQNTIIDDAKQKTLCRQSWSCIEHRRRESFKRLPASLQGDATVSQSLLTHARVQEGQTRLKSPVTPWTPACKRWVPAAHT